MFLNKKTIKKISKNKKILERKLKVKLQIKNSEIEINGEEFEVYIAEKVIEAIERNFPIKIALLLIKEDYILEDIPIKSITRKRNLSQIKSRLIGKKGKTLRIISEISNCYLSLHENVISIIGPSEKIKDVTTAIKNLIRGSKQSNIYLYLEKTKKKDIPENLGLKPEKPKE